MHRVYRIRVQASIVKYNKNKRNKGKVYAFCLTEKQNMHKMDENSTWNKDKNTQKAGKIERL